MGTSDLHGNIERGVVLSGYVENLRKVRKHDGGVVLVDAGDMFQGTLAANETEGAAVIRLYNAMGYNAAVVGNHEFDYGPAGPAAIPASPSDDRRGALIAAAKLARFPVLTANILMKDTGAAVQWPGIAPSTMVDVAGIKVGIVGVTTDETLRTTIAANVDDLRVGPLAEAITAQARKLRDQGAKVVVAAAHAGGDCANFDNPDDVSSCKPEEIFAVARALDPKLVNVIIGGHTHRAVAHRVNGIPIIQSRAYGTAFGRVDLVVDPASGEVSVKKIHAPHRVCEEKESDAPTCTPGEYEGERVQPSAQARDAAAPDLAAADAKRKQQLGVTLATKLKARGAPSSPLGDQLAAWMLEVRPAAQIAYINAGGIRKDLPEGPLTYGAFFEMFPFDNRFASTTVKVSAVRKLFVHGLSGGHGFSVAGVQVRAKCGMAGLEVELIHKGKRLRDDQTVSLLMSDYLAMTPSVNEAGMPKESFKYEDAPPIREALVEHLRKKGGTVTAPAAAMITTPEGVFPVKCGGKDTGH
ncbi:MAG TPA: 5'-nucleotidase C-terminal domain-containing protein [Polyangiaceae bacterium]|nr:5'-nucleotidase C-terminal domain-containing protein [Polyangiaceae bacterium]